MKHDFLLFIKMQQFCFGIGTTIPTHQDIQCLLYARFLKKVLLLFSRCLFLSVFVRFCEFLSVYRCFFFVYYCSMGVCFCLCLSVFVCFYLFSALSVPVSLLLSLVVCLSQFLCVFVFVFPFLFINIFSFCSFLFLLF